MTMPLLFGRLMCTEVLYLVTWSTYCLRFLRSSENVVNIMIWC